MVPGIVDSSLAARPSFRSASEEVLLPDRGRAGLTASGLPRRVLPDSSHGVLKDCPSIDIPTVCPLPARCRPRPNEVSTEVDIGLTEVSRTTSLRAFGPKLPGFESCSARAVSHDFGGLRHTMRCGSVAPRCRPWGSPGCRLPTGPSQAVQARPVAVPVPSLSRPPVRVVVTVPGRVGGSCERAYGSTRPGSPCSCRQVRRPCCRELSASTPSVVARGLPKESVQPVVSPPRARDVAISAAPSGVGRLPGPRGRWRPARCEQRALFPAAGSGRPTFAVSTLPPSHEVGSDPPALACLRAVLSGAVPFEAFPSSTAR